jgi:hypothetical protein
VNRQAFTHLRSAAGWECPCGRELAKSGNTATPVRTVVSLREPACLFCGRRYKDEYRVPRDQNESSP